MMEWIKHIPNWLLVTLISLVVFALVICMVVAVSDGRRVDLGPLTLHESASSQVTALENQNEALKAQLEEKGGKLSEQDVLNKLPPLLRGQNLDVTIDNIEKFIEDSKKQHTLNLALQRNLDEVKKVDGTFLYKLLIFNQDATCYGSTLNFTAGKDRAECLPKAQLAERFLEFLSEIDFYAATTSPTPVEAKAQLLRLQDKYEFNTKGWYGPDVFKSIISEFYSKS